MYCKKHQTEKYCKNCASMKASKKRRTERKIMLANTLGGKCQSCNYDTFIEALDFHHVNPKEKLFTISKNLSSKTYEVLLNEVLKCVLVCCRCHREIEAELRECPKLSSTPQRGFEPHYVNQTYPLEGHSPVTS